MTIYTDAKGRPIEKPDPKDFQSTTAWLRAYHDYQDRIADVANKAFSEGFKKGLK